MDILDCVLIASNLEFLFQCEGYDAAMLLDVPHLFFPETFSIPEMLSSILTNL